MSTRVRELPPVACLMGPTGTGKTALALWLAARLPIEIVSVDSALVYRGMDIGTAKPDPFERCRVRHHLIDLCDPRDAYSVARFCVDAAAAIADIEARGRIPLLVGGTGLYLCRLETGIAEMPHVPQTVRDDLERQLAVAGSAALHVRLAGIDPASAARIHPNDPQRIVRALAVWQVGGRTMSSYLAEDAPTPARRFRKFILAPADRDGLRARQRDRFHGMLDRGFINEVAALRERPGLTLDRPALRAVGYRAIWRYLEGELDHAAMVALAVNGTAQYAKRQYTWFRHEVAEAWLDGPTQASRETLLHVLR